MKPERWQQIDALLQSALERGPDERPAFLDAACRDDPALRREVESLLESHEKAASFIEEPAIVQAAEMVAAEKEDLLIGRTLGHFHVLDELGRGGMGVVYLARDTRLHRQVALKLLPSLFTVEAERMRRFHQEARAASALNHPNILTIYEIGEIENHHFIATELIRGETLRERIRRKPLKLVEALDIALQVAAALAAAHEARIVHRDIKPENVMLRTDGYVKVLDFGLAKLVERLNADSEAETFINTDTGIVMGTTRYMSPEQARGLRVDARTDIWSLGVVLYEMVTAGSVPFEGKTAADMIVSILEKEPLPLTRRSGEVPAELERIVARALTKKREARYQTAKEIEADLRTLKQRLEFEAETGRSAAQELSREQSSATGDAETIYTDDKPVAQTDYKQRVQTLATGKSGVAGKRSLTSLIVILALASALAYFYFKQRVRQAPANQEIRSLAVLPFVNATSDAGTEYLSDGITESIINSLSQLPRLKVLARSTMFRYKGREVNPQDAGRELGVEAVMTGRIFQVGDRLVVRTALINVRDGSQMWGEQYDRKTSDLLTVQKEIAREISERLRSKLTGEEQKRVGRDYTDNVEAYRLYLKGRFEWNKFSPEGLKNAIEYYNQAIRLDPTYAPAYVGLSESYSLQAHIMMPPHEAYPKSKRAAEKALELDDTLAEAHSVMGMVKMFYDWDWPGAEREFNRAIALNPNNAGSRLLHTAYMKTMGRFEEFVAGARRSQELDPLSPLMASELAEAYYFSRQYDDAIRQGATALELDPHFRLAYHVRGRAFAQKGMYREAIAEFQKWVGTGRDPQALGSLGQAYGMAGQRDKALEVLAELDQISKQRYFSSYWRAIVYVGLGDRDQAFRWLEKAFEERYFLLVWMRGDPRFDPIRSDPRYADLLRRMNMTPLTSN